VQRTTVLGGAAVVATTALLIVVATITYGGGNDEPVGVGQSVSSVPPTPSVSASPSADPSEYPTAATTGWQHTGVKLTPYKGPNEITKAGTVIDGKDLSCIWIQAPRVVIKRSRVRCDDYFAWEHFVALRVNCHGVGDGIGLNSDTVVQDSYIHDLVTCGDCHNDGIQSTGGTDIVIRHNRIDNEFEQTSCILLGTEDHPLKNVLIENNLFNGGGYTVYGGGDEDDVSGIKFIGNRFMRKPEGHFRNGGHYGPVAYFSKNLPGNEWKGNVWDDNDSPVGPDS
jgi:hypothetical protein